ncbi:hypothetical protein [Paenibacillus luteus]|uniref:hypothetical protein n=1 Tax=Paenibacillus luteus TaxID=2545753 RepID=UPI0013759B6A|nr:hypothetical protein [Paenibacillus luteus]
MSKTTSSACDDADIGARKRMPLNSRQSARALLHPIYQQPEHDSAGLQQSY